MKNKISEKYLTTWNDLWKIWNFNYFSELNSLTMSSENRNTLDLKKPFNYFSPWDLKVVILGQDPYPTTGDANGLAFDVSRKEKLPPSLNNILKKVAQEYKIKHSWSFIGLKEWAKQGVLLINTVPILSNDTKTKNKYKRLTIKFLSSIANEFPNTVFIGFGNNSLEVFQELKFSKEKYIWGVHPSPLSAYRGFFEKDYFTECNKMLKARNFCEINWLSAIKIDTTKSI